MIHIRADGIAEALFSLKINLQNFSRGFKPGSFALRIISSVGLFLSFVWIKCMFMLRLEYPFDAIIRMHAG
jgi:hypothetical protein